MISRAILRTDSRQWTEFDDPQTVVLEADAPHRIPDQLRLLETEVERSGLPAVGFLTYEAAAAYGLAVHDPVDGPAALPLLCFTLFRRSREVTSRMNAAPPCGEGYRAGPWTNSLDEEAYRTKIGRIRSYLHAGDTYQVNFTFPMTAPFSGDPEAYFRDMCVAQEGRYAAYLELEGGKAVLSASPELFLERRGVNLVSKPMKGTAPRGLSLPEDRAGVQELRRSPKERAENLMITDMIRNDLGRVAIPGSVRVPGLFQVERYPRVLQMISRVEARSDVSLPKLMAATFPCASITGAPKKRTMEIIRELESGPRGVYTGSIGVLYPGRRMRLNVAIRTVVVDRSRGRATFGVGGGIVWDSRPEGEYRECATKANILANPQPPVTLLETIRWNARRRITLFPGHLRRLRSSAAYFSIPLQRPETADLLDEDALHRRIAAAVRRTAAPDHPGDWRVRLLVRCGSLEIEVEPLPGPPQDILLDCSSPGSASLPVRSVAFSPIPIPDRTPWVLHKTTARSLYQERLAAFPEAQDVLLCNSSGNLTESCTANILVTRSSGRATGDDAGPYLATPPLTEGLLPGVFRDWLLHPPVDGAPRPWTPGILPVKEEPISREVLREVRNGTAELYLVNSLRGWMHARLLPDC